MAHVKVFYDEAGNTLNARGLFAGALQPCRKVRAAIALAASLGKLLGPLDGFGPLDCRRLRLADLLPDLAQLASRLPIR